MTGTPPTSAVFTASVTLMPAEPEHFDQAFTATTQPCPWPKAYGGDLVAQAAAAAMRSATDDKPLDSMHSYFLRPADIGAEVRYQVEVLRDGRGYSTRQVRGYQYGKVLYVCLANFAAGEAGSSFHSAFDVDVPDPDSLTIVEYGGQQTGGLSRVRRSRRNGTRLTVDRAGDGGQTQGHLEYEPKFTLRTMV
ncbi:acyl-CoA thioesterase domain-containing protein [Streptomyces sp. ISID311]|uniref:acyl-CoA thioesterase n=1 Tax=Streptomyces sp. ISID311 TaxID=2601673 RepID=UPI0011BD3903|nr:acyl-CoA thioesterase domain-containing protein [Streptomyces sp. ISID311]TXC99917.1 hypothetical protein FS847_01255 [Streptomyces sp. ISID311]